MTGTTKSRLMMASSALAVMMATPVMAQTAGSDGPALEEVTVQGVRGFGSNVSQLGGFRGAQLIDVPATVNVLPRDLLDAQSAQGLNDILKNISGSSTAQTSPVVTSNETIRGIALDNRNAFRLDGSLPFINLLELPIEDKERVEVLKGAAGLYYGFASPAGVINATMKRPTQDPLLDVTAFGNGYGANGVAVDFGNTVGNGLFGYRINGVYAGENPGITNEWGNRSLIAGAFDFRPIKGLVSELDLEHIYKKQPEPGIFRWVANLPTATIANPYPTFAIPDAKTVDPTVNFAPSWALYRAEETNVLWHNTYNITDWWDIVADAGDSKFSRTRNSWTLQPTNFATGAGTAQYLLSTQENENRNLRFQTDAVFDTWFLKHNVTAGWQVNQRDGYSANSPQTACASGLYVNSVTASTNTSCQTGITNVGTAAAPVLVNYLNPAWVGVTTRAVPVANSTYYNGKTERIEDSGFYIFDRIEYGDYLEVSGGFRQGNYNDEILKPTRSKAYHATPATTSGAITVKPFGDNALAVYASYVEALEPGTQGPITVANPGVTTAPLPSVQTEIGVKSQYFDGLLLSADFFTIHRGSAFINAANLWVADGKAKYQGVEFNASGSVTDDLSVYATGMLLMAKQQTGAPTCGPGTAVGTLPNAAGTPSCAAFTPTLVGLELSNTAKGYGSIFAEYKLGHLISMLDGVAINGGMYYTDHRPIDSQNRANLGGFTTFDAGASYDTTVFQYPSTFRVSAKNIFNMRYWAGGDQDDLSEGLPADVEMSLKVHL